MICLPCRMQRHPYCLREYRAGPHLSVGSKREATAESQCFCQCRDTSTGVPSAQAATQHDAGGQR